MDDITGLVLATGAVGTAAFGIVDGLKWMGVSALGFGVIQKKLEKFLPALKVAYGPDALDLLKSEYRNGRSQGPLPKTLRQGVRIGLVATTADGLAAATGVVDANELKSAAEAVAAGRELDGPQRGVLGRYELAADARIEAALALAEDRYVGQIRVVATGVAVLLSLVAAWAIAPSLGDVPWTVTLANVPWTRALIVGIAAVPLAPIAKDVANAIAAASKAVKGGR